jgi:hypothetical protein
VELDPGDPPSVELEPPDEPEAPDDPEAADELEPEGEPLDELELLEEAEPLPYDKLPLEVELPADAWSGGRNWPLFRP